MEIEEVLRLSGCRDCWVRKSNNPRIQVGTDQSNKSQTNVDFDGIQQIRIKCWSFWLLEIQEPDHCWKSVIVTVIFATLGQRQKGSEKYSNHLLHLFDICVLRLLEDQMHFCFVLPRFHEL